jgi:hypothetical protein
VSLFKSHGGDAWVRSDLLPVFQGVEDLRWHLTFATYQMMNNRNASRAQRSECRPQQGWRAGIICKMELPK